MTISSMTGFARVSGQSEDFHWVLELKSVNNKGLDVRVRVPSFLDGFDIQLKKQVMGALTRGSVFVSLNVERHGSADEFILHEDRLATLIETAKQYEAQLGKVSLDGLLAVRGVVDLRPSVMDDALIEQLSKDIGASLDKGLAQLSDVRQREGGALNQVLLDQLGHITEIISVVEVMIKDRPEMIQNRFKEQLAKLEGQLPAVSEERLAQEVALLVVKMDISEEIDRLKLHDREFRKLLAEGGVQGRRLDFLCQELHREANTLCSKSGDGKLTALGLDLKTTIDQMREQVQNIE